MLILTAYKNKTTKVKNGVQSDEKSYETLCKKYDMYDYDDVYDNDNYTICEVQTDKNSEWKKYNGASSKNNTMYDETNHESNKFAEK